jgi:hypothetical protein
MMSHVIQGKLEMWLEIMTTQEAPTVPKAILQAPKPDPWQIRIIVWRSIEVPLPEFKYFTDMFITVLPMGYEQRATDVHPAVTDGNGNFNYRLIWDIDLPTKLPRIKFCVSIICWIIFLNQTHDLSFSDLGHEIAQRE